MTWPSFHPSRTTRLNKSVANNDWTMTHCTTYSRPSSGKTYLFLVFFLFAPLCEKIGPKARASSVCVSICYAYSEFYKKYRILFSTSLFIQDCAPSRAVKIAMNKPWVENVPKGTKACSEDTPNVSEMFENKIPENLWCQLRQRLVDFLLFKIMGNVCRASVNVTQYTLLSLAPIARRD